MASLVTKPRWLLLLLAGAFAIPYVASNERFKAAVSAAVGSHGAETNAEFGVGNAVLDSGVRVSQTAPASAPPLCDMASAFRFDVTPQWVTSTWPRVTTAVADGDYALMRLPLVTGLMPDDLVGTLTYYFDDDQRVMRITFAGNTGDSRRLVALVTSQYGLSPQRTVDAGLYQTKWNGATISTLHIRHASVVSASASHGKYDVQLDLKRADGLAGTAGAPQRLFAW
jgi:hypothetical protein